MQIRRLPTRYQLLKRCFDTAMQRGANCRRAVSNGPYVQAINTVPRMSYPQIFNSWIRKGIPLPRCGLPLDARGLSILSRIAQIPHHHAQLCRFNVLNLVHMRLWLTGRRTYDFFAEFLIHPSFGGQTLISYHSADPPASSYAEDL